MKANLLGAKNISYGRQNISKRDVDAVEAVLKGSWLTQGPKVPEFESKISAAVNSKYAVAFCNATSALHAACIALQVGVGDIVWTTPNTFVASANCALYCGASIDFIDIDKVTFNMSVDMLESKLKTALLNGGLPKVVIPVHFGGLPCDMERIYELSRQYDFKVIEDASHAIGGRYKDSAIGDCTYSDITIFSFHPVKIITTGEGGVLTTNDPEIQIRARDFRSHGITSDLGRLEERPCDEIWNYQQISLGYHYRLTDIAAALGISQLERLREFQVRREKLVGRYNKFFDFLGIDHQYYPSDRVSGHHLYVIKIPYGKYKINRNELYQKLQDVGVGVNIHYIPVYLQPFYASLGFSRGYCPVAERYFKEALSLPLFPDLTDSDQDLICKFISEELLYA